MVSARAIFFESPLPLRQVEQRASQAADDREQR